jgi:UDP-N-acetylglucosamine acyltransferase
MQRALYRDELTLEQARERIASLKQNHPEAETDVAMMLDFLAGTSPQRGIVR